MVIFSQRIALHGGIYCLVGKQWVHDPRERLRQAVPVHVPWAFSCIEKGIFDVIANKEERMYVKQSNRKHVYDRKWDNCWSLFQNIVYIHIYIILYIIIYIDHSPIPPAFFFNTMRLLLEKIAFSTTATSRGDEEEPSAPNEFDVLLCGGVRNGRETNEEWVLTWGFPWGYPPLIAGWFV